MSGMEARKTKKAPEIDMESLKEKILVVHKHACHVDKLGWYDHFEIESDSPDCTVLSSQDGNFKQLEFKSEASFRAALKIIKKDIFPYFENIESVIGHEKAHMRKARENLTGIEGIEASYNIYFAYGDDMVAFVPNVSLKFMDGCKSVPVDALCEIIDAPSRKSGPDIALLEELKSIKNSKSEISAADFLELSKKRRI